MPHPSLPSTQSAVFAVEAMAARHGRSVRATHDIGRDQTFAGLLLPEGLAGDLEGIPHEALLEIDGAPGLTVRLFVHDEAVVTVDGIAFDVPRDSVPPFLDAVWGGLAHVRRKAFPPSCTLVVAVPGEASYREAVTDLALTPWLAGIVR